MSRLPVSLSRRIAVSVVVVALALGLGAAGQFDSAGLTTPSVFLDGAVNFFLRNGAVESPCGAR